MNRRLAFVPVCLCSVVLALSAQISTGRFNGTPVQVEFMEGTQTERRVKLLRALAYQDPSGKAWYAEKGFVSDGASIPRPLWTVVGAPLDGQYRIAAILHDRYCVSKSERYEAVHRMFYDAMIDSGLTRQYAGVLYAGVLIGGPRWPTPVSRSSGRGGRAQGDTGFPQPAPATTTSAERTDEGGRRSTIGVQPSRSFRRRD